MADEQVYEVTVDEYGDIYWRQNGFIHRIDGPAVEWANGTKEWIQNGKLHRLDGPAVECVDGHKEWYKNGKLHRIDGPAVKLAGHKIWHHNDEFHRIAGPAAEWLIGDKEYWIEGERYFEKEYFAKIAEMKAFSPPPSCAGKIVTIDGKQYKLKEI